MRYAARSLAVVVLTVFVGALLWAALRAGPPIHRRPSEHRRTHEITEPNLADLPATEALMTYLSAVREQQIRDVGAYIAAVQEAELAAYLEAITPPPPPAPTYSAPVRASGARSYAWWEAIATCESGNTNAWRTGYYGLEAGYPIGHLSKSDQLAWAERIYAQYGDGAWGCSPVAWQNVPGG
jgi:hypothetical protein